MPPSEIYDSYLAAAKMKGVILNRGGAQVKNLSEAAVAERFFGLQPQNDTPVKIRAADH